MTKAVIMAGGSGTRLRPLTSDQPKPMIPIVNVPCMEHIVRLLESHGFTDIVATLQFMPEEIRGYFGDGSGWGVNMRYSVEDVPAGTAGSVKLAEEHLEGDRILVVSGDALTDADLTRIVGFHEEKGAEATMVLKSVENPLDFGIVITEEDGRISRFLEKPAWGQVFSDTVNTGIYLLEPSVLEEIPPGEEYDFSRDLFPKLLEAGRALYGYVTQDYWQDIGTLEQYMQAQRDVLDGKMKGVVRPPGTRLRENLYVGLRAQVNEEELTGPVVIGENVRVDEGAEIGPYSVIADNVVIAAGATVERSVIGEGTYVGEGAELSAAWVGRSSYIQPRARLLERSASGDDVIVGEGATVAADVKVYPHKTVESGANVTQSLIYETMGLRTLFKGGVVSGKFNVDLTPELVVRLASSFATELDPGVVVTVGRGSSRPAQAAKRAMVSALTATGVNVRDLRAAHAGVVRHDVLAGKSVAGAHVRAGAADDPDEVEILFFSSDATPMSEPDQRAVERVFSREEYRRAHGAGIGELVYPGRVVEQYVERLARAANPEKTRGAALVVDFCGGVASLVAGRVFQRLGIRAVVMEGFTAADGGQPPGAGLEDALDRVRRIVPTVGAAFGAVVGSTGEDVHFVDDLGEPVPADVMLACFLERLRPEKAVLPINLSRGYEELIGRNGGKLQESRTSLGNVALKAAEVGADVAGLADGHYVFPVFLPAPDCFMTLSCALELFREEPLSGVRTSYGEAIGAVRHRTLECPWADKGRVMRGLAERFGADPDTLLTEGVKLNLNEGWVLMLPDPDNPLFYVYAEAKADVVEKTEGGFRDGQNGSEGLVREYAGLVEGLIKSA